MMEILTLGGYNEVGKNMTAVKVNNSVVILDMGFFIPKIIDIEEQGPTRSKLSAETLQKLGAIPDDTPMLAWKDKVKAIIPSHAHLDHIGAIPYLGKKYPVPIYGTPYTMQVLRNSILSDKLNFKNKLNSVQPNDSVKISEDIEVEFINMTHSTLQTAMVAVHTKKGTILYANDFKFDNSPIVGTKPNYKRLKELGKENVIALVLDSLYSGKDQKTPSEKVAQELLKDVLLGIENSANAIIVTAFASHIARLKSVLDLGKQLNRKVIFLGRSMLKYITAAEELKLVNFSREAEVIGFRRLVKKKLGFIQKDGPEKYLIVCTGGQGEKGAVLTSIASGDLKFNLQAEDNVIFSNRVIPVDENIANRDLLENNLKNRRCRIFKDVHVSGHAAREDLRDLVKLTNPQHIIPAHGSQLQISPMEELAVEMGYKKGKSVHSMRNGSRLEL